jgi:hypothetical protein
MIVKSLVGLSLVLSVSLSRTQDASELPDSARNSTALSVRQKEAALLPLVFRATECIVREVGQRAPADAGAEDINDLIVDSMTACAEPVRAMIDAHDLAYGEGSGETFLLGPYLDVLPSAVVQQVKVRTH